MQQSDGYKLIRQIGSGLAGPVWLADGPRGRVALRRFVSRTVQGSDEWLADRAHFLQAGRLAMGIQSPRVVHVLEAVDDGTDVWIASDLVEDETLETLLKRERLSTAQSGSILRVIAMTLDSVHRTGAVHGDLKPSNIFVGAHNGNVRVADFAISPRARRYARGPMSPEWIHPYLSPEHLLSPGMIGPKSDQYALAAIAYRLYTGQAPFAGGNEDPGPAILRGDLAMPSAVNRGVPRGLDMPLLKALSRDPGQRYESCSQLVDALDAGAAALMAASRSEAQAAPSSKKMMYVAIGSLVAALLIAALLLPKKTPTSPPPVAPAATGGPTQAGVSASSGKRSAFTGETVAKATKAHKSTSAPAETYNPPGQTAVNRVPTYPIPSGTTRPSQPPPAATTLVGPIDIPGAPKGFSLAVYSRGKLIDDNSTFGLLDKTMGEMGVGDLSAKVIVNGVVGKGKLSILWTIDGNPMGGSLANPNSTVTYQNEPSPGAYKVILRQDLKVVSEYQFRITPP